MQIDTYFSYPFNSQALIRNKDNLLDSLSSGFLKKVKIYVLSGSTTHQLDDFLRLFLAYHNIECEIKVGEYNTYYTDAMFEDHISLWKPDFIYLHTSLKNIQKFPEALSSNEDLEKTFATHIQRVTDIISNYDINIIMNNIEYPLHSGSGPFASSHPTGIINFIRQMNDRLLHIANDNEHVFLNDLNYLSSVYGLDLWHDWSMWSSFKYAMTPSAFPLLASSLSSIIANEIGTSKKALICDLDNTLWGGVIGDDGSENIQIGPDTAKGEQFKYLQNYVSDLGDRGIILAINSKNDETIALTGFDNPHAQLDPKQFASISANWMAKSQNMTSLSQTLNIGLDSFVFIDDNPVEVFEVSQEHPSIRCISYKKSPIEMVTTIDRLGVFASNAITLEDKDRAVSYRANALRTEMEATITDKSSYLNSLEMTCSIRAVDDTSFARASQLLGKTNQFNLTQQRFSETQLKEMQANDKWGIFIASLDDKFGKNGIVSVIVLQFEDETASIVNWVMSCRVFNRTLENTIFDYVHNLCKQKSISTIKGQFHSSPKNAYVADLFAKLGFKLIDQANGICKYQVSTSEDHEQNKFIKMDEQNEQ